MNNEIKDSVETQELTDAAKQLLSDAGSNDKAVSMRAQAQIAKVIASALNEFNYSEAV